MSENLHLENKRQRGASHVETSKTKSDVRIYLERQGHAFLQRVFNQYAELGSVPVDTAHSISFPKGNGSAKSKLVAMLKTSRTAEGHRPMEPQCD